MTNSSSVYRSKVRVRFTQCDPAGIVFYPRYFEMINDLVEDWFREALNLPWERVIRGGWGLPTVHLDFDFFKPSTFGDVLEAELTVLEVGNSSMRLRVVFLGPGDEKRVAGHVVLVLTDRSTGRAMPLPQEMRQALVPA